MKRAISYCLFLALVLGPACKKYEGDPSISLRTAKSRLCGKRWVPVWPRTTINMNPNGYFDKPPNFIFEKKANNHDNNVTAEGFNLGIDSILIGPILQWPNPDTTFYSYCNAGLWSFTNKRDTIALDNLFACENYEYLEVWSNLDFRPRIKILRLTKEELWLLIKWHGSQEAEEWHFKSYPI